MGITFVVGKIVENAEVHDISQFIQSTSHFDLKHASCAVLKGFWDDIWNIAKIKRGPPGTDQASK